jgi:hypothetical protein
MARKVAAWLMMTAGPVFVVIGGKFGLSAGHPVLTGVLLAFYEAVVLVLAFAGGVFGQLQARWQIRVVNRIDRSLTQWMGGIERRYREFMLANLRFIDVKGLATVGFYHPELDEVFVDVSLARRAPNQMSEGLLAQVPPEVTDRHRIGDFLDHSNARILAVVGVPGSGKTTLLRHTAREICRNRRRRRRTVPILLYLRDHAAKIVWAQDTGLPELLQDTLGSQRREELRDWFDRRLSRGECVVLFDGLDEVGDTASRRAVVAWVDRQVRRYPNNDYVITSRPHGYRTADIEGATVLQVRSFTSEQVNTFVRAWYIAVEKHSADDSGADVLLRAEAAADDLLERLSRAPALYELTVNPLLLTMVANVHRYRGALPGSRVRLYEEICQVMLWRRQEAKRLPVELGGDEKEALLRRLAFTMMRRRVRDLRRDEVIEVFRPGLRRMATSVTEAGFLADVTSNGLLIERESELFSFAHLTFQEYLASAHIRARNRSRVLVGAVDDVWWREVTLLYAARSDTDPIVAACLRSGSLTALSLAFDCADQGSQLAPELRRQLEELLDQALASRIDDARRRLMIGVLVNRRLRTVVPTSNGSRICANPVTVDLYRLFQQDMGVPAPDANGGNELPAGPEIASRVVVGVRGADAIAFARWVNDITQRDPAYRLPSHGELDDAAAHRTLAVATRATPTSVWTEVDADHGHADLWFPTGARHPHAVDGEAVAADVRADIMRSTSTLSRLVLLRSIVAARLLARSLDQHGQRDPRLARDRAFDLAFDLAHTLRYVSVDGGGDLSHAHARVRELDRALTGAFSGERHERAVRLARDLDRDLVRALDHRREPAGVLDRMLAVGFDRMDTLARHPVADLDRAFEDGLDKVLGTTIANALAHVLRHADPSSNWPADLAQALIRETRAADLSLHVSPDSLSEGVRSGTDGILAAAAVVDEPDTSGWARRVARNLAESAVPVVERARPLTGEFATAIRLAALCLAADGESFASPATVLALRRVAAGMTLLECRVSGRRAPSEMIILALT